MTSAGTLYSAANSFQTKKLLAVGEFANVKFKTDCLSNAKVCDQNPLNDQVYFVTSQGKPLFDSNAIACFLSDALRKAKDSAQAAEIVQWLDVADNQFLPYVLSWVLPSLSALPLNKNEVEEAKKHLIISLDWLNNSLLSKTFLVDERLSVADIVLACDLMPAFQHVLDDGVRKKLTNVTRWFLTIVNQPFFKKAIGDVQLCKTPAQFDAKKLEDFQALHEKKAEQKGKKKKAPTEQPKAKAAPEPEEDEEPAEPKQKDPFAAFPKGKFDMDSFKRVYSNEDTETKALPHFWQNFDNDNYSIWYCEYKYPKELTKVFMSCNLVAGMFQRLDRLRKNAFASVCVFGEDNANTISGIWVWRGHELAFTLSDDWQIDYESYSWQKLDPKAEKTKTLVHDYFTWEGAFDGKKFNQGKIFK